jgi:hypothetical protein
MLLSNSRPTSFKKNKAKKKSRKFQKCPKSSKHAKKMFQKTKEMNE